MQLISRQQLRSTGQGNVEGQGGGRLTASGRKGEVQGRLLVGRNGKGQRGGRLLVARNRDGKGQERPQMHRLLPHIPTP